ncbi:hypothetical protein ElyMa_006769000 [Elysia marginata]|uniref:Uncharacterized protein n=1 Tax=Elysia marginata TaxID=1093978 RepID=A0AAV4IZ83_9GAST|nr:hypothetical protein ElyMa_006769000 [Elysia marginata]
MDVNDARNTYCVATLDKEQISQNSDSSLESAILSVLKSRTRREAAVPAPEAVQPETSAHYADLLSRSYGSLVPIPNVLIPSYFGYRPRVYVSVPQDYYSHYPKSDLFRLKPGDYLNDLLPIFKKETPTAKVDPVPASGLPGNGRNNFPRFLMQAPKWVWPDGISTGSLPSALFGLQSKTQRAVDMAALPATNTAFDEEAVPDHHIMKNNQMMIDEWFDDDHHDDDDADEDGDDDRSSKP